MTAIRLIERIERQVDMKAPVWATLPPLHHVSPGKSRRKGGAVRLFYSYSHRDERLRDKLEAHLAVLKRNGLIENWHDRKTEAGDDWKGKIATELEATDIILLLVSSDFLNSYYC
jgi:TIR domain